MDNRIQVGRRAFIAGGSLFLLNSGLQLRGADSFWDSRQVVKFGLITDLHFADKEPVGSRYYRQSMAKLGEAKQRFADEKPSFVIELGDFVDAADDVETELEYLTNINEEFSRLAGDKHYVLGNHCVYTLTKDEFLKGVQRERSYYSFDVGGLHFVVVDSCFLADGTPYGRKNFDWTDPNIPKQELSWLAQDLEKNDKPAIVFAHQRLDKTEQHSVKNAVDVRKILQASGRVLAVFQGHSHQNDYQQLGGIHYCTLVAMVEGSGAENNGYSTVTVSPDGSIQLTGFRKQLDYSWS